MTLKHNLAVKRYDFDANLFNGLYGNEYAHNLWPLVYILSDGSSMQAYVGETSDAYARMATHLKNSNKNKLTTVHLITSKRFNKSATLDIESNLIKYISGDGKYKLFNANVGLANHTYYEKEEYWQTFKNIWDNLRSEGIAKHSLDYIDNSDLFKYSPYKSLTQEQKKGLLRIMKGLLNENYTQLIIEGGAGTGKTILATFLFKLLKTNNEDFNFGEFGDEEFEFMETVFELKRKFPDPKMALVIPMSSFRNTIKRVFKNVKGLNANMVIGPAEVVNEKFDIILVDESHRLRKRVNLGAYYGAFDNACKKLGLDKDRCSELNWILLQSKNTVLFYDENQSIKPSDVNKEDFDRLKNSNSTSLQYLKSQFRVKGGDDYVKYVHNLLDCDFNPGKQIFSSPKYEFLLFDSIDEMVEAIKLRNKETGLSRLIAGYSWEWVSNKNKKAFDIKIGDTELRWNSVAVDWVNSESSIDEVGCIHTTQGYDLNYAGVIFGNEIGYDKERDEIVIHKENYFDKNGKQSVKNPEELKNYIINIYKTIMLRGIKGTYVYACNNELQAYLLKHIANNNNQKLQNETPQDEIIPYVNSVPLYNLKAAAGSFSEQQVVDNCEWIMLPRHITASQDLFACKVVGESMNKIIPNGATCLFRKYSTGSRDGKIVLVAHSDIQDGDFGSGYTIKEYRSKKTINDENWSHETIILKPLSFSTDYKDIVLLGDDLTSLKVVGIFDRVLNL